MTCHLPCSQQNILQFRLFFRLALAPFLLVIFITLPPVFSYGANTSELADIIRNAAADWPSQNFDAMLNLINIEGGKQTDSFLRFLDDTVESIETFNGVPGSQGERDLFKKKILATLDERRFAQVDGLLQEVPRKFPNLEAGVRTGSSGLRHLGTQTEGSYRPLLSDDDITFVGKGANEAKTWFNQQVQARGLGGVKIKGFTLNDPDKFTPLDKAVLDLLDPEKFVGQAAMSGIRSETMKKGAMVLGKGPDGKLGFMRTSLAEYLQNTKSMKSALDAIIEDAARRYGPLTMIASVERQIVSAHEGWDNLTTSEKIKYVLRSRKKLSESVGGLNDGSLERLEKLSPLFSKFPPPDINVDDAAFLLQCRKDNLTGAFEAANNRIMALADREAGTNLAANPEVRAAVNELATGFAMLKQLGGKPEFNNMIDIDGVIEDLLTKAQGNPALKKILYTAKHQADDMLAVLAEWSNREDSFAKMLEKLPKLTPPKREETLQNRQQLLESKASAGTIKEAEQKELQLLRELSSKTASPEGDALLLAMIKSPAGKKVLVALALTGGGVTFAEMYKRWSGGGYYNDLSSAASTLVDFIPGAMSFERMKQDGYLSPGVAYQFVKEAMYLTWLWPVALTADIAAMGGDMSQTIALQYYHDALVEILESNGEFKGDAFVALQLADGQTIGRDQLSKFLQEDKTVRLRNAASRDLVYETNLSGTAADVYARYYVENDPVLINLKKALLQQIQRINVGEGMTSFGEHDWSEAAKSGFRLLFAVESVCSKMPKQWCELVKIYQDKLKERAASAFHTVMVPHLISLAEDAHKALKGSDAGIKRLMEIQRVLEELRGSPLGVDLALEVAQQGAKASDLRKTAISGDTSTKREQNLAEGGYIQAAVKAYETILKEAKETEENVAARTRYNDARVLAFPWTGDFYQDATRARQSRRGFMADTNAIVQDVTKIKGSAPDVLNKTDAQALDILAAVAYPNRSALDESNSGKIAVPKDPATAAIPEVKPPAALPGSPFFTWYKDALEKVKALYASTLDLQKLADKGAILVPPGGPMFERVPGVFEVRITDPALRALYNNGKVGIKWRADQPDAAFASPNSLKSAFTPVDVGEVGIEAIFSLKADPAVQATLKGTIPVGAAQKPSLALSLAPNPPKPGKTAWADAVPDSKTRALDLAYSWTCDGCTVLRDQGARALIQAPEQGQATVTARIAAKTGEQLAEASLSFDLGSDKPGKPAPDTDNKPTPPDQPAGPADTAGELTGSATTPPGRDTPPATDPGSLPGTPGSKVQTSSGNTPGTPTSPG